MVIILMYLLGLPENIENPAQEIVCPRWISEDSEATVPDNVSLSPEQKKRNKLRCYWSLVKAAERVCIRSSPRARVLCEARTQRWLQQNFAWTPTQVRQVCDEENSPRFRNLMINLR